MMSRFVVITIALTGIAETVTGGNCPNLSSGSPCGDFTYCPRPESMEWKCLKDAMNCNENNGRYYHCARDVNGCYVHHCAKRVYCNPGQQPVLDLNKDTAMCQTCPAEEYQRRPFWSNEQRDCDYAKTKCDGEGEIECHPGTPAEDRTCRCDIQKDLALQGYAYNKRTCCSKDYDQECYCTSFKDQCPPGKVRHFNYMCLPECPQGLYRQMDAEECIAENSSSQKYETSTVQTPNQDSQVSTGIIIGLVVTTVLVASVAVLIYCLKCRQQRGQNAGESEAPRIFRNGDINCPHRDSNEMVQLLKEEKDSSAADDRIKNNDAGNGQIINVRINAPGGVINLGGKNNTKAKYIKNYTQDAPESIDVSHGASSLSTEENLVSMNPEESRHEESIMSDETSMDTVPKNPVEHEDIHLDETRVKNLPYPSQVESDDQTKRKEVWSPPEVVPDDQTKRKEVWSPLEVVPDDQTKRKEEWSQLEVVPDDQTKRKEWSQPEVVADDQTKRKEVWSQSVVADNQTKKKEPHIPGSDAEKRQKTQMFQSSDGSMSSREMEIFKPKVHEPDEQEESRHEESIMSDETSMDTVPKNPVEHEDIHLDETRVKNLPYPSQVESDDQTKRKEVWSPPEVVPDDQTKRKEVWSPPEVVPDDQTKRKEVWSQSVVADNQTKKKEPHIPGSDAEKRQKTQMFQSSDGSMSSREMEIFKPKVHEPDEQEESRHEESIMSDETSMDTVPKNPVEHEDIHLDETRVKNLPYPSQVESDDQTKRKEVWSPPEVVPDDQTKRKEVWSPLEVVPDDQTKRKEEWSQLEVVPDDQTKRKEWSQPEVVADDQTKRKEEWSQLEVVPDDQTKRKEWSQPEMVPDNQTKRKEVWNQSVVADNQTKKKEPHIPGSDAEKRQKTQMFQSSDGSMSSREMEIFKPKVHEPDEQEESRHEESIMSDETSMDTVPKNPVEHEDIHLDETRVKNLPYPSQVESDDQTKRKEVWSPPEVVPDDQTKRKEVWSPLEVVPDDQTKRKEEWSQLEVVPDDQTKRKEWSQPEVVADDQTKRKEVWSQSVVADNQTKKKEPHIPGSDAEKRQKTQMFQSSDGSMSSREMEIFKPKVHEPDEQEESEDSSQEDVEETKVKEI